MAEIYAAIANEKVKDPMGPIHQYQPEPERVKEEILSCTKGQRHSS
jgi:hypothetical protein